MNKFVVSSIIFLAVLFQSICAGWSATPILRIDKRNASSATRYFVSFCVRTSPNWSRLPGHCYIAWESQQNNGVRVGEGFGFQPTKSGFKVVMGPGDMVQESLPLGQQGNGDCTLEIEVSKPDFDRTIKFRESKRGGTYVLGIQDCVAFCDQIALILNVVRPQSTTLMPPHTYMQQLYNANVVGNATPLHLP